MTFRLKQLILLFGDLALFYLALFLALTARYQRTPTAIEWDRHWPVFSIVFFIWMVAFYLNGLYDLSRTKNNVAFFRSYLTVSAINFLLAVGFFYVANYPQISPKTILILLILIDLPLFALWRFLCHRLLRASTLKNRLLFLGLTNEAVELIKSFAKEPQLGYQPVAILLPENNACLTGRQAMLPEVPNSVEKIYNFDGLLEFIRAKEINTIILALPSVEGELKRLLYETIFLRVAVTDLASFYEMITHRVPLSALSEIWFLENLKEPQKKIFDLFRQLIDYLLAIAMLILLAIFFLPVSLIIYLYDRGPVLYRQTRVGKDGKTFTIYKFRSMIPRAEAQGTQFTKENDSRITKVGKILRLLHLDELPQSLNILKGEMAFIGPRPERPEFVAELQKTFPFYQTRHLIKPGLTGWGQINYNYTDSLEGNLVKLQYDLYYIKNRSLLVDAVILLKTITTIVKRIGR